jgi:hypothetical protein
MRYLSGYERTGQMMGIGYLGEVRQGPDGNLYQWIQGVDGLGNPIGFWKKLKKWGKRLAKTALKYHPAGWALKAASPFLRQALPYVQRVASAIPLPQAQAVAAGLKTAAPLLREAGVEGYDGLGALYQAPDGRLYQVEGWGEADDLRGFAEDDLRGFAEDELRGLEEVDDLRGLGALYQAPDGTLYQVQGFEEADDLRGFAEDELRGLDETDDLRGFDEADDLRGFAEDDLRGLDEADDLRGFAEDDLRGFAEDDLRGFDEADDLRGFAEDDLRGFEEAEDLRGLEAYVPNQPAGTRWFVPPSQPPDMWRPLW